MLNNPSVNMNTCPELATENSKEEEGEADRVENTEVTPDVAGQTQVEREE